MNILKQITVPLIIIFLTTSSWVLAQIKVSPYHKQPITLPYLKPSKTNLHLEYEVLKQLSSPQISCDELKNEIYFECEELGTVSTPESSWLNKITFYTYTKNDKFIGFAIAKIRDRYGYVKSYAYCGIPIETMLFFIEDGRSSWGQKFQDYIAMYTCDCRSGYSLGTNKTYSNSYRNNSYSNNNYSSGKSSTKNNQQKINSLTDKINQKINQGRIENAESEILELLSLEYNNTVTLIAGSMYEKKYQTATTLHNHNLASLFFEKAETYYKQAIQNDKNYFDAQYSSGALYFNATTPMRVEMNKLPLNEVQRYEELKKNVASLMDKALPYFLAADRLNSNDYNTVFALKEIYARKGDSYTSDMYNRRLVRLK